MRYLFLLFIFYYSYNVSAQNICIDSSSHFQYKTLPNDSLRIQKTILTKDSSKVSIGFFLNGFTSYSGLYFISKINKQGQVVWFKKMTSPFVNGQAGFESVEEASNGNIFVGGINPISANKPFFYLVFSATGNFIYQSELNITNSGANLSNAISIHFSLISKFGVDSVLLVVHHPVVRTPAEPDAITLLSVSNNGLIGQAYTFVTPLVGSISYYPYYSKCKIENNSIFLYGSSQFTNACMINFIEQPVYVSLQIDWAIKQVINKKAFCSPPIGYTQFGFPLGEGVDNHNTNITLLANGNTIFYRQIWGLDFNGGDTLTHLFKTSEFDRNFTHVKSEYICTRKRFSGGQEWDYHLYIDSLGFKYISTYDFSGQKIYYAIGNSNGSYFLQKSIPHPATRMDRFGPESKRLLTEPGYLTSFDIVSGDNQHNYIDNFRVLAKDTATACFGTNIDLLSTKPGAVSPINWQGVFEVQQAAIETSPINFTIEDYSLQRIIICNIVNKCDTIKINAPDTVCNISQPVIITAHKNPLCSGKVNFTFDTTSVQSFTQINDTTLSLTFNKSYKGKIFARPSTCDKLKDSVEIVISTVTQPINIGKDTLYCPGKKYLLTAYNPNFRTYYWQDGSTDSIYLATTSGIFYVTTTDYCNRVYSDTIRIIKKDFKLNLGKDSTICKSESMVLTVPSSFTNYSWQPNYNISYISSYSVNINPEINTSYRVEAEVFSGCKLNDTINITVENCPQYIYFPNSFTPNNNGLNDTFRPLSGGAMTKYELQIYNRWGQLIFRTTNKNDGWTGKLKGIQQDNATFVWLCKYQFYGKPEKLIKGTLVLIR